MSKQLITSPSGGLIIEDPSDDEMEEDDCVAPLPFLMRHHHPSLGEEIPTVYKAFKAKSLSNQNNQISTTNVENYSSSGASLSATEPQLFSSSSLSSSSCEEESRVVIVLDCANLG